MLEIDASGEQRCVDVNLVRKVAKECIVPLTVGGGIQTIKQIQQLIHSGADKVSINAEAWRNPSFLSDAADVFGHQCLILSCDLEAVNDDVYTIRHHDAPMNLKTAMAKIAEIAAFGAGEILLQSCNQDGLQNGYDLKLLREAAECLPVPLIALGGAGHPSHFEDALSIEGVSAAAAGNYFHFFEHSVLLTKQYLLNRHPSWIRQDIACTYSHASGTHHTRYPL